MEKEYTYYSVKEFVETLSRLTETEHKKLILFGRKYCLDYNLECEGIDLFQEAVTRYLSGSRKAPKELALVITLFNAMKSIGNSLVNSRHQKIVDNALSLDDEDGIDINKLGVPYAKADEELSLHKYQLIIDHFGGDKEVLSMIELIGEGLKAKEITDILFEGERKKYDTAYKRFMRKRKQLSTETLCI